MMARVINFIAIIFNVLILINKYSASVYTGGCTATPLIPDRPFVVVWNHPTSLCEDQGIHLDFDAWGIVDNTRDRFFGQQIALFYSLGKWPSYNTKDQPVNGGLPQLSDLQAHLTKVDADLKTSVWNKTFSGLGVIDMESWRPTYWTNFDSKSIYQQQSLALAKQRFPQYNKSQLLAEAIKEFNKAARDFMSQTLQRVSTKRPNGKWGYYLFPRCFDRTCNTTTITNNDRISWLFQESSALYPSIYFKLATPHSGTANQIKQTLHEAFRVKAKYSPQDIPIMPYSKSQEGPYKMYQKLDLSLAVLQPANMGSSGVVIWGSSTDARAKNECLVLKDYINNVLGPYSRNVTNYFGNCTEQLCNGNGRCVRKDYERVYQQHLRESGRSECLIPDKILSDKQISQDMTSSEIKNMPTRITETERNGHSRGKNKTLTFIDHIKKYISFNLKYSKRYRLFDQKDKFAMKSSESVVKFSIESKKQTPGNGLSPVQEEIKYDSPLPSTTRNDPNPDTIVDDNRNTDTDAMPSFDDNAPFYDFDDYVCKCYPGYTGNRCQNKHA